MTSTEESTTKIQMVCFDLGGVLVRIHRAWEDSCKFTGFEIRKIDTSESDKALRNLITTQFASGKLNNEQWIDQLTSAFQNQYTPDEICQIHDNWLIEEYPDVRKMISQLNNVNGITTACLSNTNPRHWKRLVHINEYGQPATGEPEFPVVTLLKQHYASHLIGYAKPAPEIYQAFEKLTGFAGREILFFDDLPDNINTANKFGWNTVQVDHTGDTANQIITALKRYDILLHG